MCSVQICLSSCAVMIRRGVPLLALVVVACTALSASQWHREHKRMVLVCRNMTSLHRDIKPQRSRAPYTLTVAYKRVLPNGKVRVTVSGADFKAVYLQARHPHVKSYKPVGQFLEYNKRNTKVKLHSCEGGKHNALAFYSSAPVNKASFTWKAPGHPTSVVFRATVAPSYKTFWVGIESRKVAVAKY